MERRQKDAKERRISFEGSRRPSRERERERGAPLFEIAGWQNANYLALFPACKDACKKGATPLVPYSYLPPSTLSSITPCTHRDALWPGLNVFSFSLSLFRPLLCFFFLFLSFLDRHRWIKFSFIFVGFLWGKGFEVAYDPIFGFVKSGLVCALEIYEEETSRWTQVFATRSC